MALQSFNPPLWNTNRHGLQMSTLRMGLMTPLVSLLLLLWTTIPAVTAALDLSGDILQPVPSCAQSCFTTFVNIDFTSSSCSSSPSLQCLCSQTGARGFTLGEMAVQCIFAEVTVGRCSLDETNRKRTLTLPPRYRGQIIDN